MQIFMDQELNDAMKHPKGPNNNSSRRMLVNDPVHMTEYQREFDSFIIRNFISVFFFFFFLIQDFLLDL